MSRIKFLDNADKGENNWLRYLFTSILAWGAPNVLGIAILGYISILYMVAFRTSSAGPIDAILNDPMWEIAITGIFSVVTILFLYIGVRYFHERKFISIINTGSKVKWRRILKGAGIWSILLLIGVVVSLILDPGSVKFTFNPNTFGLLLILSLIVFTIQAPSEELFFRGYLMQGIGRLSKKPIIPLLVTSVIFASLHWWNGTDTNMSVDIVLQVFIFGLSMGIIALGENGIETAMGVHISNNIFVAVVCNTVNGGLGDVPSILTSTSSPDILIDTLSSVIFAIALLVIVFWGKKDSIYNIFKGKIDMEMDKMEVKEDLN